jgi:hypothetical protein
MNNEFVSYEIALKLKELGFDEPCFGKIYADGGNEQLSYPYKNSDQIGKVTSCSAPLYQQVFRWFREKYDIDISINTIYSKYNENISKKYRVVIDNKTVFTNVGFYDTYEEAQIECIMDLISIIKNQKK